MRLSKTQDPETVWFRTSEPSKLPRHHGPVVAVGIGALCAAGATALRAGLTPFLGGEEKFVAIFPALLLATYFGGGLGGFSCLFLSLLAAWYVFIGKPLTFYLAPGEVPSLVAEFVAGAAVLGFALVMRRLIWRLERANEAQRLLTLELQHRVKNNLAVVEAMASQSARGAVDLSGFLEAFLGRLRTLSTAYGLLSRNRDDGGWVGDVVAAALAPFNVSGRVSWSGPPLTIDAEQSVTLALCLHELATNAVKYGALSTLTGRVVVHWSKLKGDLALLEWCETGGPPVTIPKRAGLGTRLLRRGIDPVFPATIAYSSTGLTWSARFRPTSAAQPLPPVAIGSHA